MLKACLLASALLAQQADPAACALVEPDDMRLRCYDAYFRAPTAQEQQAAGRDESESVSAVAPLDASRAPDRAVAPESPTPTPSLPVRVPEEEFGLTPAQLAERDRGASAAPVLDRLEVRVSSVGHTGSGHIVLMLDNGQRWMEVTPSQRVRFRAGEEITIRRASLGSFLARGPNSGGTVRIRRMD